MGAGIPCINGAYHPMGMEGGKIGYFSKDIIVKENGKKEWYEFQLHKSGIDNKHTCMWKLMKVVPHGNVFRETTCYFSEMDSPLPPTEGWTAHQHSGAVPALKFL